MSKLLIPASGQPSKKLSGGGSGGLVLAANAPLTSNGYAVKQQVLVGQADTTTALTADDAVAVIYFVGSHNSLYQHSIDAQALYAPVITAADGMDLGGDATSAAGKELVACDSVYSEQVEGHNCFKVGSSGAFYLKGEIEVGDISSLADLYFGFRSVEAHGHSVADYSDYVAANVTASGAFQKCDNKGDGTENQDADATYNFVDQTKRTFEIKVSASGVTTVLVDGNELTGVDDYTFTSGVVVTPFLHFIRASNTNDDNGSRIRVSLLEFGLEASR